MYQVKPIRVGIVGTGVMGGYHARVAAMLPGCQFVGIHDASIARADEVADMYGVATFPSLAALCENVDAVIVASPTNTHAEVGAACLQAGCHVLVEKPIAGTVADAEQLLEISKKSNRILMIGHVERYNPAITALTSLLPQDELFAFELQRVGPTPPRDRSADIIFDLMIHDLDLAMALSGSSVISITAMGHRVRSEFIDHVTAMLRFASGTTAVLTASAVSQERSRKGRFYTQNAQFTVDLASREISIHRHGQSSVAKEDGQYYIASQVEQLLLPNREPLAAEQEHFYQSIQQGTPPLTNGESGLETLRLAQAIQDCVNEQLVEQV